MHPNGLFHAAALFRHFTAINVRQVDVYLKLANLIELALRLDWARGFGRVESERAQTSVTGMLLLAALMSKSHKRPDEPGERRSALQLAEELGCSRTRVSMELRRLVALKLVGQPVQPGDDRRTRLYSLTKRGCVAGSAARSVLNAFEADCFRKSARHFGLQFPNASQMESMLMQLARNGPAEKARPPKRPGHAPDRPATRRTLAQL